MADIGTLFRTAPHCVTEHDLIQRSRARAILSNDTLNPQELSIGDLSLRRSWSTFFLLSLKFIRFARAHPHSGKLVAYKWNYGFQSSWYILNSGPFMIQAPNITSPLFAHPSICLVCVGIWGNEKAQSFPPRGPSHLTMTCSSARQNWEVSQKYGTSPVRRPIIPTRGDSPAQI